MKAVRFAHRFAGPCGVSVAVLAGVLAAPAAIAQYKVVGPDGRVTYTDRQPLPSQGRVTSIGPRGTAPIGDVALPLELRQPVARYPVTLYNLAGACGPCESARRLLRERGVPYTEKLVQGAEDAEALQRLTGSRDAPALSIGSQTLRGLAPGVWSSYLDAAGYPRESRLPVTYQYPPATPLTDRREASSAASAPAARGDAEADAESPPRPPATAAPTPSNPSGIKF